MLLPERVWERVTLVPLCWAPSAGERCSDAPRAVLPGDGAGAITTLVTSQEREQKPGCGEEEATSKMRCFGAL